MRTVSSVIRWLEEGIEVLPTIDSHGPPSVASSLVMSSQKETQRFTANNPEVPSINVWLCGKI